MALQQKRMLVSRRFWSREVAAGAGLSDTFTIHIDATRMAVELATRRAFLECKTDIGRFPRLAVV
jgi:hypothetical protein